MTSVDFAKLSLIMGAISILNLIILHINSREFHPGWRMVSEYALGKHKRYLTAFFFSWCFCAVSSALAMWSMVESVWAMIGLWLVIASGIGAYMGGWFDVKHKLHGLAFAIGIPTLPTGALLIAYHLVGMDCWSNYRGNILLFSHAVWITVVLMALTMMLIFAGFKKAGVPMGPNIDPPKSLPAGIIGINGYANRLLILCYIGWSMYMSYLVVQCST